MLNVDTHRAVLYTRIVKYFIYRLDIAVSCRGINISDGYRVFVCATVYTKMVFFSYFYIQINNG